MGSTTQLKQKLTVHAAAAQADITPAAQVQQMLKANKNAIAQILPKVITPERMAQITYNAVRVNPRLLQCTQTSFLGGIIQAAILGLEPNTIQGHCYLIPFYNSRAKVYEVQFIPGYRGLVNLARRSGKVGSIAANAVRQGDFFEYEFGLDEKLRHIPADEFNEDAELTHTYSYSKLAGGFAQFVVMARGQVLSIRNQSSGYRYAVKKAGEINVKRSAQGKDSITPDTPWVTHEDLMFAKTGVIRLYKLLPCTHEMATAEALDSMANMGTSQDLSRVLEGEIVDHTITPGEKVGDDPNEDESAPVAEGKPYQFTDGQQVTLNSIGFCESLEGYRIASGQLFDEKIHMIQDDGTPVIDPEGNYRHKEVNGK